MNVQTFAIFGTPVGIGGPDHAAQGLGIDPWTPPHRIEDAPLNRRQNESLRNQPLAAAWADGEIDHGAARRGNTGMSRPCLASSALSSSTSRASRWCLRSSSS